MGRAKSRSGSENACSGTQTAPANLSLLWPKGAGRLKTAADRPATARQRQVPRLPTYDSEVGAIDLRHRPWLQVPSRHGMIGYQGVVGTGERGHDLTDKPISRTNGRGLAAS